MKIIDIWASWCMPCKVVSQVLDRIQNERPDLVIEKINVDEDKEAIAEYNVKNIPVILIEDKDGNVLFRHTGAITKQELDKKLDELDWANA